MLYTKPGILSVIPAEEESQPNDEYDKYIYHTRHLVENAFLHLKCWLCIAARYAKNSAPFLAVVQIKIASLFGQIFINY